MKNPYLKKETTKGTPVAPSTFFLPKEKLSRFARLKRFIAKSFLKTAHLLDPELYYLVGIDEASASNFTESTFIKIK